MANVPTTVGDAGELVDPNPKNRFEGEKSVSTRPGDLFWDQLIKYAASGMILLAAFDILASFTSTGVRCLTPDSYTRDQSAFINGYCSEHTPVTDYFLFYLLAQAILIAGPQIFWQSWFSGRLSFFVALASSLDRHRDSETGEYAPKNFVTAKELLNAFYRKHLMFRTYLLKLMMQLLLILGAVAVCSAVFNDFNTIFPCPRQWDSATNQTWPLPTEVNCTYSVLRSNQAVWITNYVLLALALGCTLYGIAWCAVSHGNKLNWKEAAEFVLESGISQSCYHSRGFFRELFRCRNPFRYHIRSDLDFLVLKLFPQDVGRAHVLRELLIGTFVQKELDTIRQRLNLLRDAENAIVRNEKLKNIVMNTNLAVKVPEKRKAPNEDLGWTMAEFLVNVATSETFGCDVAQAGVVDTGQNDPESQPGCRKINGASINISFGSLGYTHILAQLCERVLALDFHPHLVNRKEPALYTHFHSEIHNMTTMSNIYALPVKVRNKLDEKLTLNNVLNKPKPKGAPALRPPEQIPVRLIVVSPFTNPDRIITVNWYLYLTKRVPERLTQDTLLITFTPVTIGHSDVKFVQFKPTSPWKACNVEFKHDIPNEVKPSASSSGGECRVSFSQCAGKTQRKPMNYFRIKSDVAAGSQQRGGRDVAAGDQQQEGSDVAAGDLQQGGSDVAAGDQQQGGKAEDEGDDWRKKNTVVLQCGGVPCKFNVMVYKQQE